MIVHLVAHPYATLIALVALSAMLKGAGFSMGAPRPVAKRFLTRREQAMLVALERVLPHCRIHAQVAMGALLAAPENPFRRRRLSDHNAFSQKIVDFVAQDRGSGAILALIEVDDWSHVLSRDAARDLMTGRAGYRTIRIPSHARPTFADVRASVSGLLPSPVTQSGRDAMILRKKSTPASATAAPMTEGEVLLEHTCILRKLAADMANQHLTLMLVGDGSATNNLARDTVVANRRSIEEAADHLQHLAREYRLRPPGLTQ